MTASHKPRLAYLFSRYPVISHTFIDNEMLALQELGWDVLACGIHPPKNDLRHDRLSQLQGKTIYGPSATVTRVLEEQAKAKDHWPQALIDQQIKDFGKATVPADRCRNALHIADRLKSEGVQHIHLHFANQATHTAMFIKELSGITYSFTPQAADFLIDLESVELLNAMVANAEFVVAPCDYAKSKLIELCPGHEAKFVTVYNGIGATGYPTTKPQPTSSSLRICSVGRLVEIKGFGNLINAINIAKSEDVTVHLDLMGDGPLRNQLERQVADLNLGEQVTFHGSVNLEEMKQCFCEVDAFVLACRYGANGASDMLPTVITEAMLSSLPVISTRLAGVPEQVADGETGILCDPEDETALATALVKLANTPELAANMGIAGKQRALKLFSIEATLPKLETQFAQLDSTACAPQSVEIAALYKLNRPGAKSQLELEKPIIESMNGKCWLQGNALSQRQASELGPHLNNVAWIPDAMALEMEWRSRAEMRSKLENLRTELSTSVDGEWFLGCARIALWLAVEWSKTPTLKKIYASGTDEALIAWQVHQLNSLPFAIAVEDHQHLSKKLRTRIFQDASAVAVTSTENPLSRPKDPDYMCHKYNFVWQRRISASQRRKRQTAFRDWIQSV